MADLIINTDKADENIAEIQQLISEIGNDMAELNSNITKYIPTEDDEYEECIKTSWSAQVRQNWDQYKNSDIPAAMEDMSKSASNLRIAAEKAREYESADN